MSPHSNVKVWRLTPEQMASYVPVMDLGEPHHIEQPKHLIFTPLGIMQSEDLRKSQSERAKRSHEARKLLPTKELHAQEKAEGKSDKEIASKVRNHSTYGTTIRSQVA